MPAVPWRGDTVTGAKNAAVTKQYSVQFAECHSPKQTVLDALQCLEVSDACSGMKYRCSDKGWKHRRAENVQGAVR